MSKQLILEVIQSTLPASLKATAATLADYASDDGHRLWPKISTLSTRLGKGYRAVQSDLAELRRRGILHVKRRAGHGRPADYWFDVRALNASAPARQLRLPLFAVCLKSKDDLQIIKDDLGIVPSDPVIDPVKNKITAAGAAGLPFHEAENRTDQGSAAVPDGLRDRGADGPRASEGIDRRDHRTREAPTPGGRIPIRQRRHSPGLLGDREASAGSAAAGDAGSAHAGAVASARVDARGPDRGTRAEGFTGLASLVARARGVG